MGFFCKRKMDTKYINEILSKDIQSLGCSIWGVELSGKYNNQTLRIYIDNEEGVSIEDCERVSKHIIKVLDAQNDFSNKYLLEVSSPGLDRKFFFDHQYQAYINSKIKITFWNNSRKKVSVKGMISKITERGLLLSSEEEKLEVPFSSIIKANLIM